MKGVFVYRAGSIYNNDIVTRYHFSYDEYLANAGDMVDDWIVYQSTIRGEGRSGYFAVAQVKRIQPDEENDEFHYAYLDYFLPFDKFVPLNNGIRYYEDYLNNVPKKNIGVSLRRRSVRILSEDEFTDIILAGFSVVLNPQNSIALDLEEYMVDDDVIKIINAPEKKKRRHVIQFLLNRKIRDASFRRTIMNAYDSTCAVTRARIINGKGRAEAQAAHIDPVANHGPDTVGNGIALSSTCHWLFDRHLISLSDNYGLLVKENKIPRVILNLIKKSKKQILLPKNELYRPRIEYIQQHRKIFECS